ncbi:MAG: acyl carrier protein [Candidatus Adiutrix sp.]|jgi:acyl carrier protein|nr:acyl carrier protein [Candidatus Adiutrix sp.]
MSNIEKYNAAFVEVFGVTDEQLPALAFQSVTQWDSIGHMQLIAALETAFDIMMDTEDIMDFSSYEKGKEYMGKYGVKM